MFLLFRRGTDGSLMYGGQSDAIYDNQNSDNLCLRLWGSKCSLVISLGKHLTNVGCYFNAQNRNAKKNQVQRFCSEEGRNAREKVVFRERETRK